MADNAAQDLAAEAAASLDAAKRIGDQLALFDEPSAVQDDDDAGDRGPGRPPGARNKLKTGLAQLMAAQGYRDPASQLARMAGLHSREDQNLVAIQTARAILEASRLKVSADDARELMLRAGTEGERKRAFDLWCTVLGEDIRIAHALPGLVMQIRGQMEKAASALLPYTFAKVTPDVNDNRSQMVVQITAPAGAPEQVRASVAPPPMPMEEAEQYQEVSGSDGERSDGALSDGGA